MSRTYRRKRHPAPSPSWDSWHRDWSCNHPYCCGGVVPRMMRRAKRAADKAALRRDPDNAPKQARMNEGQQY